MKPKAVLISLAISCVLAIIAIILLLPELRGSTIDARPVFDVRVGDVTGLELTDAAGGRRTLSREGGDWILSWPAGNGQERRWPAEAGNVRGAIRLLIENLERDSQGLGMDEPEATLTMKTASGDWQIEFGASRVGGQTAVRVTGPDGAEIDARIGTQVRDVFTVGGLMAWRSTQAMAFLDRGVDRVYLRSKDLDPIRLARLNGRWSLVEPIAARADDARCQELLTALRRMRIVRFYDELEVGSEATGLDEPGAIIALERDVVGEPGTRILTGAAIGITTDLENTRIYVALEQREVTRDNESRVLLGPIVASVAVEEMNAILPFARAYLSRRTLEASIPDVRRLEIVRRGSPPEIFNRNVTGWTDARGASPTATTGETLDDLLGVLASEQASQIELDHPEGWVELALVEARDSSGASLGRVGFAAVERDGKPIALATQIDGVVRMYPVEAHLRLVSWLRRAP